MKHKIFSLTRAFMRALGFTRIESHSGSVRGYAGAENTQGETDPMGCSWYRHTDQVDGFSAMLRDQRERSQLSTQNISNALQFLRRKGWRDSWK